MPSHLPALGWKKHPSEAKPAKLFGVALPVFGDLDAQVEVDLGAQQLLDLGARGGTHFPQPRAALADDNALLAVPLHVEDGVHIDELIHALAPCNLIAH